MEKKETFRFGVMGAGNISNKFCDAAEKTEEVCVTAVAARSEERAREFAEKYEIHTYYGNYEEMLQKEKLDGVYIGVVTGMHVQLTELCIRYGIPVLCEKALTGSSEEAERIFKLAEEKKIFVMEGVWSLFLPANRKAREWLREGRIGKLAVSNVEIGFTAPKNKENRYFNKEAGGGAFERASVRRGGLRENGRLRSGHEPVRKCAEGWAGRWENLFADGFMPDG